MVQLLPSFLPEPQEAQALQVMYEDLPEQQEIEH
jgi:hypothetical protein